MIEIWWIFREKMLLIFKTIYKNWFYIVYLFVLLNCISSLHIGHCDHRQIIINSKSVIHKKSESKKKENNFSHLMPRVRAFTIFTKYNHQWWNKRVLQMHSMGTQNHMKRHGMCDGWDFGCIDSQNNNHIITFSSTHYYYFTHLLF